MPVEKTTPQLVKKGKGKKRPGYRGDAAYGRSSRSSQATSIGQARGATGSGGGASLGGGRDRNEQPAQQFIGGKSYNVTPETRGERDRAQLKQQIMNQTKLGGNRIDKFGNTKKSLFRGGGGGIGSLLASLFGLAMGIPGLGLLTGGFDKLKGGLGSLNETLGDFREKTTGFRTQAEYDAARQQRQLQGRLDNMYDRKSKGKNFSQKNIDMLESQYGLSPSTAQNVLTGRDLKGFTPSRMGLQTTMTPMAKPTFSDPFANTVGTTTQINNPQNTGIEGIDVGYPSNDLMAGLTKMQQKMLAGPQKNLRNIMGISDQEILNNISPFNDPEDPATLEEVQTFYGADGGLASMFTRRG